VECHRSVDHVRAFEKECAIGNFWNPETLACQKSLYVNCTAGKLSFTVDYEIKKESFNMPLFTIHAFFSQNLTFDE
jgi:hypothetical protein